MRKKTAYMALFLVFSCGMLLTQARGQSNGPAPASLPLGSSCVSSPSLGGAPCIPVLPRWNAGFYLGGATTPGNATVTLTSTGPAIFNQVVQKMDIDVSGVLIGMSLGYALNERLGCRIEAFDVVPSWAIGDVKTTLQTGGIAVQKADSYFHFDGVRGEGYWRLWSGLSLIGGLYYESLDLRLANVKSVVSNYVDTTNEGKADFHTLAIYGGAEYSLGLPFPGYLLARAVGCPSVYCHWFYGVPFRDPNSPLFPILDSGAGNFHNGTFGEILVRGALGFGFAEFGGFAKVSAVTLKNTIALNSEDFSTGTTLQQPFQMDFSRSTVEGGGYVTIPF
jgi:hypothetical protein